MAVLRQVISPRFDTHLADSFARLRSAAPSVATHLADSFPLDRLRATAHRLRYAPPGSLPLRMTVEPDILQSRRAHWIKQVTMHPRLPNYIGNWVVQKNPRGVCNDNLLCLI